MPDFETAATPESAVDLVPTPNQPIAARPFRPRQFLLGLLLAGTGVALILSIAFLTDTLQTVTGTLSIPALFTSLLLAIPCIGLGFALMCTAAATPDESEFDRLLAAGNSSQNTAQTTGTPPSATG